MTGSARIRTTTTSDIAPRGWAEDVASMPEAWPFLSPAWLAGTTSALSDRAKPLHAYATRAPGEEAWLAGYIFEGHAGVDWDPRTYLGWEAPDGAQVCCGVESSQTSREEVDAWGADALFPCLVVGSPLGYRSEPAYNFWGRGLFESLTTTLLESARDAGAASVIAPWIPARWGTDEITAAFARFGGDSAYWGLEDYLPLRADSYADHLAAQPKKRRQRMQNDQIQLARSGLTIMSVRGEEFTPHIDRIAELVCLNREKNGAHQEPAQISAILRELIAADADLWGYLGELNGTVVAASVALRRRRRVFVKWAGFDYEVLGTRSGLYFPFGFDMPMRDAYADGVKVLEFGAGAHEAKTLRGCESRAMTTALWVRDEEIRPRATELLKDFGRRRRDSFGAADRQPTTTLPLASGDNCCGGTS